jgi:superoxide dismutase, Fe-Mn family
MKHELPNLEYRYDALEPFIDAKTMEIHHTKHHQAYVDKFNKALEGHEKLQKLTPEEIIKNIDAVPDEIKTLVRNHGGGTLNHSFFWKILKKDSQISLELTEAIGEKFGNFENFKTQFAEAAMSQFGSGWAWLVLNNGHLEITTTQNQDNPLSEGKIPLLNLDVWEHAYYLKYKNKRNEYVDAFFNIINWEQVNKNFTGGKNA